MVWKSFSRRWRSAQKAGR